MKLLKKISKIILSLIVACLLVTGIVIGYVYFFKLNNASDLNPHSETNWQLSVFPKNITKELLSSVIKGERNEELRESFQMWDSLKENSPNMGINPYKPFHLFGDEYMEHEILGTIIHLSNKKEFEKNYSVTAPNFFFAYNKNAVCILTSESLSNIDLENYYNQQKWNSHKYTEKAVITFHVNNDLAHLIGQVSYAKNKLRLTAEWKLEEEYEFDNSSSDFTINLGSDVNGKQNPFLKAIQSPIQSFFHTYKGVMVDIIDGEPLILPKGETLLTSNYIDTNYLLLKHPDLKDCNPSAKNVICWTSSNKTLKGNHTPIDIQLKGIQLLKINGNPLITTFLSMSPVIGDAMEIISNMDNITIKGKMKTKNILSIEGQIDYNDEANFLEDIAIYILKNEKNIKELESLLSSLNKK